MDTEHIINTLKRIITSVIFGLRKSNVREDNINKILIFRYKLFHYTSDINYYDDKYEVLSNLLSNRIFLNNKNNRYMKFKLLFLNEKNKVLTIRIRYEYVGGMKLYFEYLPKSINEIILLHAVDGDTKSYCVILNNIYKENVCQLTETWDILLKNKFQICMNI
jgi:hypothetical protein